MSKLAEYEKKWIQKWRGAKIYQGDPDVSKKKFITTFPFPYQNGPLHVGHAFTATRADVATRFKRMQGYNALFPWSWHLTGEAVAGTADRLRKGDESVLKGLREIDGVPEELLPKFTDPEFISRYYMEENRKAVDALGLGVDWRREFYTTSLHPWFSRFIDGVLYVSRLLETTIALRGRALSLRSLSWLSLRWATWFLSRLLFALKLCLAVRTFG